MILGIGTDILETSRIAQALQTPAFANKCFTKAEQSMLSERKPTSHAGNFAAKEAVAKALGTGFTTFSPSDIEVLRDEAGKPYVTLTNGALSAFTALNATAIHITISDCEHYATATAIIER